MSHPSPPPPQPPALENVAALQQAVLAWYAASGRDLPWRRDPYRRDPYALLVAEVMLQQTQVERVVPRWRAWLERFPNLATLAAAPTAEVIRAWEGLGYNLRALRLQQAARAVAQEHGGALPDTEDALLRLPGLGPYTAAALAAFAFGRDTLVLDTNVRRVVGRVVFGTDAPPPAALRRALAALLPQGRAAAWYQALMDLGATVCAVRRPRCLLCPARPCCRASTALQDGHVAEARAAYRTQPPFKGSRRYYRGRAVAALRAAGDRGLSLADLGPQVRQDYGPQHADWLADLVRDLAADGLVALQGHQDDPTALRVALPG